MRDVGGGKPAARRLIRVESKLADPRDAFFIELGHEAVKQSVPTLNDALTKMVVLGTAVVGGGLTLLDKTAVTWWGRVGFLSLATVSLIAALYGLLPRLRYVNPADPDEVRGSEREASDIKGVAMWVAAGSLAAAFVFAVAGATWVALGKPIPPPPMTVIVQPSSQTP